MRNMLHGLLIALLFSLLAACGSKENLPPPASLTEFNPTINVYKLWGTRIGHGSSKYYFRLNPAVAGNIIYINDYNGYVYALDAMTGNPIWERHIRLAFTSGIAVDSGKLFIGSENGRLLALNASDGKILWQAPIGSEILATPTAVQGIVLVKTIDGVLAAVSESDGQLLWRFTQEVPALILHAESQPIVAGGIVVAGFANGRIAAINLHSGKLLWLAQVSSPQGVTDIERMVDIDVTPIVIRGIVYAASYRGHIAAIELQSGRFIWRHLISSYTGLTADGNRIYISDAKGHVWAFDEDLGTVAWRQDRLHARMVTGPALQGHYVVVADGYGYVHWLSTTDGQFAARMAVSNAGTITEPVVVNGIAYIYTRDGQISAFKI